MNEKLKNKLAKDPNFNKAVIFLSGVYLLHSIVCQWYEEAEDNLHKAGALRFDFKHEFNSMKHFFNRFELAMRKYCIEKEMFIEEYSEVEKKLREFLFKD